MEGRHVLDWINRKGCRFCKASSLVVKHVVGSRIEALAASFRDTSHGPFVPA